MNITSPLNNIQPFADGAVYKDPNLILSRKQRGEVQVKRFITHGLDTIDFSEELQRTILLNEKSFFIFNGSPLKLMKHVFLFDLKSSS